MNKELQEQLAKAVITMVDRSLSNLDERSVITRLALERLRADLENTPTTTRSIESIISEAAAKVITGTEKIGGPLNNRPPEAVFEPIKAEELRPKAPTPKGKPKNLAPKRDIRTTPVDDLPTTQRFRVYTSASRHRKTVNITQNFNTGKPSGWGHASLAEACAIAADSTASLRAICVSLKDERDGHSLYTLASRYTIEIETLRQLNPKGRRVFLAARFNFPQVTGADPRKFLPVAAKVMACVTAYDMASAYSEIEEFATKWGIQ